MFRGVVRDSTARVEKIEKNSLPSLARAPSSMHGFGISRNSSSSSRFVASPSLVEANLCQRENFTAVSTRKTRLSVNFDAKTIKILARFRSFDVSGGSQGFHSSGRKNRKIFTSIASSGSLLNARLRYFTKFFEFESFRGVSKPCKGKFVSAREFQGVFNPKNAAFGEF